jgi:hypothetical protein
MENKTEPNLIEPKHSFQPFIIVILIILTLFSTTTIIYLYRNNQEIKNEIAKMEAYKKLQNQAPAGIVGRYYEEYAGFPVFVSFVCYLNLCLQQPFTVLNPPPKNSIPDDKYITILGEVTRGSSTYHKLNYKSFTLLTDMKNDNPKPCASYIQKHYGQKYNLENLKSPNSGNIDFSNRIMVYYFDIPNTDQYIDCAYDTVDNSVIFTKPHKITGLDPL